MPRKQRREPNVVDRFMGRFEVVPHGIQRSSAGMSKNVSMPLARTPRVNALTGRGNSVGPTYPGASGWSRMARTYAPSRPGSGETSSSMNSMYSPLPCSLPTLRESVAPRHSALAVHRGCAHYIGRSLRVEHALKIQSGQHTHPCIKDGSNGGPGRRKTAQAGQRMRPRARRYLEPACAIRPTPHRGCGPCRPLASGSHCPAAPASAACWASIATGACRRRRDMRAPRSPPRDDSVIGWDGPPIRVESRAAVQGDKAGVRCGAL